MRLLLVLLLATPVYSQDGGPAHADWPHYGGTHLSWRYSALDQINTTNVRNLLPAWIFQTGDYAENLHSTPIVVDGVMYLISARHSRQSFRFHPESRCRRRRWQGLLWHEGQLRGRA